MYFLNDTSRYKVELDVQHSCRFSTPERGKGPEELAAHAAVHDSTVAPPGMLIPKPRVLPAEASLQMNEDASVGTVLNGVRKAELN